MSQNPWGDAPPPRPGPSRLGVMLWLAGLAAIVVMLWFLSRSFPGGDSPLADPYLWRLVAVLAVASSGLLLLRQMNLKQVARGALAWLAVGAVLLLGFVYQDELKSIFMRVRAEIIPSYAVQTGPREMTIAESEGGGYFVYGAVNGVAVKFLVDTGASSIVLSPADATRAGIDLAALNFDRRFETANGTGFGASTRVLSLSVGDLSFSDVNVSVNKAGMSSSLLGMTFLKRLKSFRFQDRKLVLHW